ncbi:RICIN domain-containing protein [Amycolatopsis sp. NPDC004747]
MFRRSRVYALLLTLLAALGVALAGAPAEAATDVQISVLGENACLDNATENAGKLQMWRCTGGAEQRWIEVVNNATGRVLFVNKNTDWCITAPPGAGSVVMRPCNSADPTQQWGVSIQSTPPGQPFAVYELLVSTSGLCLWTSTVRSGTVPSMAGCDGLGSFNERWVLS